MKIKSLKISNILSFPHVADIEHAPEIKFDQNLSILIGQNGAGKSTVLEIINFIFRKVLFSPYIRNTDLYTQKHSISVEQKRQILTKPDEVKYYRGFRMEKNYDFEDKQQCIRVTVELDDIDRGNIEHLKNNRDKLSPYIGEYTVETMFADANVSPSYQLDITLDSANKTYIVNSENDLGFVYLTAYNLYKEIIELYNEENEDKLNNLSESFALIGGYRNYSAYTQSVSLGGGNTATKQISNIRTSEFSKSATSTEVSEPTIFSLVRLRMAELPYNLIDTGQDIAQCERAVNELEFVKNINNKLRLINLKVEIKRTDKSSWNFSFSFIDLKRKRVVTDINSLSAGQKSLLHLIFESYGRGELRGGLVIIDEPEIHLHYQFQDEYLRVIEKLNDEQGCQYILVTHSESLINSSTIRRIVRLSLDSNGYTKINQPELGEDEKWLVKILDNKRSTHAFFGSKVLLVEGESDRYFYRAVLDTVEENIKKGITQDITILDINEKEKLKEWKTLFESFGLEVFFLTDIDHAYQLFYPTEQARKIRANGYTLAQFKTDHPDVASKIDSAYQDKIFILKNGVLEDYTGTEKKLPNIINFCRTGLTQFIENRSDEKNKELRRIFYKIIRPGVKIW